MNNQILTTQCYIENDGKFLMLYRNKKENDINKEKYIGVGGHMERGESPEDCIKREVYEETGLTMNNFKLRGVITFLIDDIDEYCFLYTCDSYSGDIKECDEGNLVWVEKEKVLELPIWEGDKIFFRLLEEREDFFSLKLVYVEGNLISAFVDGEEILI